MLPKKSLLQSFPKVHRINKEVGELIGEMFQAIYLKVLETAKGSHQDTKAE